jgi:hypothetical protein
MEATMTTLTNDDVKPLRAAPLTKDDVKALLLLADFSFQGTKEPVSPIAGMC